MLNPDAYQVTVFLRWVHEHAIATGVEGRQVITAKIDGKYRSKTFMLDQLDAAGEHAATVNAAGANTYYRTHLIDRDVPVYERGKGEYTSVVTHLTSDIDIAGPGHRPSEGKKLAPTTEAAVEIVDKTSPPTVLLHSGGGIYSVHRLDPPFVITSDDDRKRIRNVGRRLDHALNRCGYHVDHTALDPSRVIRPPGVINHKPGRDPRPVTVLRGYACGAGDYSLDDLERLLPPLPPPRRPERTGSAVVRPSTGSAPWEVFARNHTVDDVLDADTQHTWHPAKDQGGMPAWLRDGSDSDYSIKQSANGVVIVWSSMIASELGIEPGDGLDLWGFACKLAGRNPTEAAKAVRR